MDKLILYYVGYLFSHKKIFCSHIFLSFNSEYESPFPALIEKFHNELITFPGPSIFNITIAKSASSKQLLIFNMDIQSM